MHNLPGIKCVSLLNLIKSPSSRHLKQIHAQLITNGIKSPNPFAKLIQHYSAESSSAIMVHQAHLVFQLFDHSNLFLFNTLIRCVPPRESILVFAKWVSRGELGFDDFSYIFVFGACARLPMDSTLWVGRQIHGRVMKQGLFLNVMVQTTAIHFYGNNCDVRGARQVFDEMLVRSSVSWNAMITGYCRQRVRGREYARSAMRLFKEMLTDVCGAEPTDSTMASILSAAAQLGVLETGSCIHGYIEKRICMPENDAFIGTGLVDMYSKCGCLDSGLIAFNRMKEKNVLTWTAMATGLAIHGRGKEALDLLDAMEAIGVKPNAVTFTSLFTACCHGGLLREGLHLFHNMERKFGVTPRIQHYGCIVDLLGRAGKLKEAYEFIMMLDKPDAILWRSLLSACRVHGDVMMGEKVGKILLQFKPEQCCEDLIGASEDYVALSNVYASAHRWEDVELVRDEMKVKRIEHEPGCSFVPLATTS